MGRDHDSPTRPRHGCAPRGLAQRRARRWGRVVGEVLLTAVVVMSAPISLLGPTSLDLVVGFVATLLPAAFLWLRRRHPVHVLVACLALFLVAACYAQFTPANVLPVAASLYSYMIQRPREHGWYVAGAVLLLTVAISWPTRSATGAPTSRRSWPGPITRRRPESRRRRGA